MFCVINFDSKRDIAEPSQTGFVDLSELLSHGVIPPGLNVTEEGFNNIEDPESIIGRPEDQFHAVALAKELKERGDLAEQAAAARAARQAAEQSAAAGAARQAAEQS